MNEQMKDSSLRPHTVEGSGPLHVARLWGKALTLAVGPCWAQPHLEGNLAVYKNADACQLCSSAFRYSVIPKETAHVCAERQHEGCLLPPCLE